MQSAGPGIATWYGCGHASLQQMLHGRRAVGMEEDHHWAAASDAIAAVDKEK